MSAARLRRPSRRFAPRLPEARLEPRAVLSAASALAPGAVAAVGAGADAATIGPDAGAGFVPMFNGVNTAGWFNPYDWGRASYRDGQVRLVGPKNFFLVSKAVYSNFVLEADVWIPPGGNSGLQFRSRYGRDFMQGYQADMDTAARHWAGGLWYQGRGWLARARPRAPVRPGRWNHYEVEADGDHIVIAVNGTVTVDTHRDIDSAGHIALQDHGGRGVYRFRNVEIDVLP